jgi:WhiB family redox-sensing transcriptional regulator
MVEQLGDYWWENASCKGMDTEIFFPERGRSHLSERVIFEVCGNCPVQEKCLEYAIENDCTVGYYGGVSARNRRVARQRNVWVA